MNVTRFLLPLILSACVPVFLTACGESAWNNPYSATADDGTVFYSSFTERPKHLDPISSYSSNEYAFIAQIYEPPLQYHFLKRPYQLVPQTAAAMPRPVYRDAAGNRLADDAPADQVAFSDYDIRIRPGIRFQPHPAFSRDATGGLRYHKLSAGELDGIHRLADFRETGSRELTAADYIYQIKRLSHPKLHSPIAGLMGDYIVGLRAYGKTLAAAWEQQQAELDAAGDPGRPFLDLRDYPLEGVQLIDRYTYRIRVIGKYPQFLFWQAMPFFAPMPWEADQFYAQAGLIEKNITLDWFPVGTGPFMLTENNPNLRMVMQRNPNYHSETYPAEGEPGDAGAGLLDDAGKRLPFIDKAIYSLEKETIPYWNKFLQGYYDSSGISSDSFDQAVSFGQSGEAQLTEAMRAKGIRLSTAVDTSTFYMGFNMLDDVVGGYGERARKLRRALAIAIDVEEQISIFRNGRGIPAQGPLPKGIFGYRDGEAGINPYVYDWVNGKPKRKPLQAARRLLAEAGYPDGRDATTGKPLVLYFDSTASGADSKAYMDWLRKQFDKLGIQLVVRGTDYNRFQEKMRKGTAQIFAWGWNADYPDPENFLFLLYGPNAKVGKGGENAANYNNPEFDRLFEQMKSMENGPVRQQLLDQMIEIARRDSPWIWGLHPKSFSLHHAWYHNAKPNLMANNTLKYKRIDPQLRAQRRLEWNRPVLWPVGLLALLLLVSVVPAVLTWRRRERSSQR